MNIKKILIISLILLTLSLTAVSATDINDTIIGESSGGDDLLNISLEETYTSTSPGTFDDLQVEINNAPVGSVLNLNRDYNGAYGSRIQFNKDLTIDGQGHTLDCLKTECSAFYSSSGNIVLKNLIIKNGHNDDNKNGGAIHIEGSAQYRIENCIFEDNWAHHDGGAIYNGADKPLTIINSQFNNNEADDDDGGAIYSIGDLYIQGSTFTSNNANKYGGAICSEECVEIKNSTFNNNVASWGGAIYAKIININNNLETAPYNTFFTENHATSTRGGAIYADKYINAVNTVFNKNLADVEGGAAYAENSINVRHCLFEYNKASGDPFILCYGGAIRTQNTAIINNITFKNNYADNRGGAVFAKDVIITDTPSFFEGNTAREYGGAIYTDKFNENVRWTSFINNDAYSKDGGAIYINKENHVVFSNCYFEKNSCGDEGGVIYFDSRNSGVVLRYNIFIDNSAGKKGEIVYTCGKFNEIKNNWYGSNSPDFTNKFTEWHWPSSDEDHSDADPVITKLSLSDNPRAGQTYNLTVDFLSKNSAKLSGNLFGFDAKFRADNGAKISYHQIGTNNVTSDITFKRAGLTTITATVNNQVLKLSYNPTKENVTMNITAPEITVGENAIVNISFMPDTATGMVLIGNRSFSYIANAAVSVIIPDLPVGIHNLLVLYSGDGAYNSARESVTIVVNRKDLNISASAIPIHVGNNATVVVTGLEDVTGNVTVTIGDKYWFGEIANGTAGVIVPGLIDSVTANVTYRGDNNHNNASTTVDMVVNKEPKLNLTNVVASAESIHAPDDAVVIVNGLENATGNLTVTIGDKYWFGEIANGTATVIVTGLTDNVTANVSYAGDYRYNNASATVNIVVYPPIQVWYVDGNRNSSGNGTSKETAFKTLKEAVNKAPDGSTIYIMPGTYVGDDNVGLFIDQNLSLVNYGGGEVIFDAQRLCRILTVNAESINITGLTFKNGNETYAGGAIFFNLTLNNSIINATFINNTVMMGAGGALAFYSGINNSVINSVFINNRVIDHDGGAIYFNGDLNNVTIGGTYNNNSAEDSGGVFYFYGNSTDVVVSGDYANNMADDGAVIFSEGIIMNSNISGNYINNTAETCINFIFIASNVNMSGNYVNNTVFNGGVIYVLYGENDSIVHDSLFINNSVGDEPIILDVIGSISAVNNWFGNNATNYNVTPNVSQNITLINWLFLNATANTTELKINETSQITFKLYSYNNASQEISEYDASEMNIQLDLNLTQGALSKDSVLINETVIYNCTGEGFASVTGKFETASYTIILAKAPTEIIVNKTDITLNVNESISAEATLIPAEAGNLTYTSSNETVAVVEDGKIKALAAGTANITVSFAGDDTYAAAENKTINVTVKLNDASVSVNNETVDLKVDDNFTIVATTVPGGLNVTYTSSNESVATVDADGKILAVGEGSAVITVSVGGDGIYALNSTNVTVTVSKVPTEISVNPVSLDLIVGNESVIVANLTPADAGNVTFTSSDKNIVTVDAQGNVIAVGEGNANITVSFDGDSKYAAAENVTVSVSVAPKPKENATISIDAPGEATEGDNVTVSVSLPEDATGSVTIGNEVITVKNGTASAVLTNIPAGNTTVPITYSGDGKYNPIETNVTINVNEKPVPAKENLTINASANSITVGENATIVVTGFEDATGNVTAKVGNGVYTAPIIKGTAKFTISGLIENVTASITYVGDDRYNNASTAVDIVVNPKPKENATIVVDAPGEATEGDNVTVSVSLPEDATGSVTIGNEVISVKNGTASAVLTNLPAGNITLPITYSGDGKYNPIETNVTINVNEKPVPAKENLTINASANSITVGENATIVVTGFEDATGNVTAKVGNGVYTAPIIKGTAKFTISGLTENVTASITYAGDDRYNNASTAVDIVVNPKSKENATIVVDAPGEATEGDNVTVNVILPEDATGTVTIGNEVISVQNGTASAVLTNLPAGNITLPIIYSGDDKYNSIETSVNVAVNPQPVPPKEDLNVSVVVDPITVGEDAFIVVNGLANATGNISAVVNGKTYTAPIKDGKVTITVTGLTENATALISYSGDDRYNNFTESVDIVVNPKEKENATIVVDAPGEATEGDNVTVSVSLPEDATGSVTIGNEVIPVQNGTASAVLTNLPAGNTTVLIVYSGDDKYNSIETEVTINVDEKPVPPKEDLNASVVVNPITVGEDAFIVVNGLADATGNVSAVVNGKTYTAPINGGKATITVTGLTENATALISYPGDDKYNNFTESVDIVVNPKEKENATITIDVPPVTEGQNTTVNVDLPEDATGNVTAVVDGKTYTAPVKDGKATITIPELDAGNYTVSITYSGDDKYNSLTEEVKITVDEDKSDIIKAPDVTKYFSGPERFVVTVTDYLGKPLANKSVIISINGRSYERTTDVNGTASIPLGLNSGVYNVTVTADNKTINSVVTILSTVNGTYIIKVFRNATQYYATFRDSQGNYLPEGTTVRFNINGVMYERKVSGDKGLARLNINLEAGEYVITAMNLVTGDMAANNITVLSRFTENEDLVKYYINASQYTVKVLGDDGKVVGAGESVTFNINGVLYTRQTDANGTAKLNINLQPGDYIITAEYKGCLVSNSIKVLPVLTASDISMKYRDRTQFKATLVDGQGKPYANQSVQFNINGVLYNRITGSDGIAKLNIILMPGEYIITSSYNGSSIANTIKISA